MLGLTIIAEKIYKFTSYIHVHVTYTSEKKIQNKKQTGKISHETQPISETDSYTFDHQSHTFDHHPTLLMKRPQMDKPRF